MEGIEVVLFEMLFTSCCQSLGGNKRGGWFGATKTWERQIPPFGLQSQMLLDIQDFDGLEVRRLPGLGCISFSAGLLMERWVKLTRLQREGKKGGDIGTNSCCSVNPSPGTCATSSQLPQLRPNSGIRLGRTSDVRIQGLTYRYPALPPPPLMGSRKSLGECRFSRQGKEGCDALHSYFYI